TSAPLCFALSTSRPATDKLADTSAWLSSWTAANLMNPVMPDPRTGAMQSFQRTPGGLAPRSQSPGLVLLYAENFRAVPPVLPLRKDPQTIGRDPSVELRLEVPAVSRRHAEIRFERGS